MPAHRKERYEAIRVMRSQLSAGDRLVVKVGTASLVGASGRPDESRLARLCNGLADLHSKDIKVVLVTSGAIAAGLEPLGLPARPSDIPSLQAAAAVGQRLLLTRYAEKLDAFGITTAQMLLTRYDFMHRQQYLNARNTLDRLLAVGALPIVNENDTIAVDEIRFGDNDMLAALVANLARAQLLVLLTDTRGVHSADPRRFPDAPVLGEIERITPELERSVGRRGSELGSGGMASKIAAAWVATFSGVGVEIAAAEDESVLTRVARGEPAGTYFRPRAKRESARRLWIAFGRAPKGSVVVDKGARRAVGSDKRSLLPVGVVEAKGDFAAGDTIDIADKEGFVFARGLVRCSSEQLHTDEGRKAAAAERRVVVHRDDLVVLEESED